MSGAGHLGSWLGLSLRCDVNSSKSQVSMTSGENQELGERISKVWPSSCLPFLSPSQGCVMAHRKQSDCLRVKTDSSFCLALLSHRPVSTGGIFPSVCAFFFPVEIIGSNKIHHHLDGESCVSVGYWLSLYLRQFQDSVVIPPTPVGPLHRP